MGTFRLLLHFATLAKIYPLEITARKEGHGLVHEDKFYPQDIELWNSIIKEDVADLRSNKWVFRFADVQPRFLISSLLGLNSLMILKKPSIVIPRLSIIVCHHLLRTSV